MKPLSAVQVEKFKASDARQEIADAGCPGLYLVVQPSGIKSWALRYRQFGKPVKLTLGRYLPDANPDAPTIGDALSLASARRLAVASKHSVTKGESPQRKPTIAAGADSFVACLQAYMRKDVLKQGHKSWRNKASYFGLA